jgi:hypothetical protein
MECCGEERFVATCPGCKKRLYDPRGPEGLLEFCRNAEAKHRAAVKRFAGVPKGGRAAHDAPGYRAQRAADARRLTAQWGAWADALETLLRRDRENRT